MDNIEEELRSLPCSAPEAKAGLRTIVQLSLVNEGIKRNPVPREDFYRQYPETSEPQTPTDLPITPYEERLQEIKELAAEVAKDLKLFHKGRVLLRTEEAEPREDLEEDLAYWDSKIKQWREFAWPLLLEVGERKEKELNGEAEKGYAEAMLLSPVQPPSPAPLDRGLLEVTQQPKRESNNSPEICMHPLQPHRRPAKERSQSTPGYNNDDLPTLPKGQKRKHYQTEDQEQKSSEATCRSKRPRRGVATTQQKQEPTPETKRTQGMKRTMPQLRSTKTYGRTRRKFLSPPPPPSDSLETNAQNDTGIRPATQPSEKLLRESYRKSSLSHQPDPGYSSDSTSNLTRGGKSSPTSLREDKKRSSNKTKPSKRQRTGTLNALPKTKPHSIPTPGEGPGKKNWKVAKARTGGASGLKELRALRVLPWNLRPRDPISYCEVGTRAA